MAANILELLSFILIVIVVGIIILPTDINDPNARLNKWKSWIDRTFKWKWLQKRYAITKLLLLTGAGLGITSIGLTC